LRRFKAIGISLIIVLVGLSAAKARVLNQIAAVVDNEVITLLDVRQAAAPYIKAWRAEHPNSSDEEMQKITKKILKDTLTDIVEQKLLEREISRLGIEATDRDVDGTIDRIKKANNLTTEELETALSQEGKTLSEFREEVKKQFLREQYVSFRLKGRVEIREEDIKSYYDQHQDEFRKPPIVTISEIRLLIPPDATKEQVQEVYLAMNNMYEKLLTGSDFASFAKTYSKGQTASSGGVIGTFPLDPKQIRSDYYKAAFNLKKGEISTIHRFSDDTGFFILRCDERNEAGIKTLDEVRDIIQMKLQRQISEEEMSKLAKELYKKSFVDIKIQDF